MSVLYCMYEKAKSFGYIGLDNPGNKNFYPRVTDHIRAGYFGKRRDSTEQPDKIQQGTKFEQVVKNNPLLANHLQSFPPYENKIVEIIYYRLLSYVIHMNIKTAMHIIMTLEVDMLMHLF